jgi:hypothetical protein
MLKQQRVSSARSIPVAGVVIVAVIAAAVAATIGLYQAAIAQARDAHAADDHSRDAQQLVAVFAEQRIVMFRYIATGSPAVLSSVEALNAQFRRTAKALTPGTPAGAQALANAVAAQAHYYSAFLADRQFATASLVRKCAVIGQLDQDQDAVTERLNTLSDTSRRCARLTPTPRPAHLLARRWRSGSRRLFSYRKVTLGSLFVKTWPPSSVTSPPPYRRACVSVGTAGTAIIWRARRQAGLERDGRCPVNGR